MKCKVIKGFIDKESKKPVEAGDEYECSESRFKEIQSNGMYLSVISKKTAVNGNKQPEKAQQK